MSLRLVRIGWSCKAAAIVPEEDYQIQAGQEMVQLLLRPLE